MIAEANSALQLAPWWVGAVTGGASTVVVLAIACKTLWSTLQVKDVELSKVTKESIGVITKILERGEQETRERQAQEERQKSLKADVAKLLEHIKDDGPWKAETTAKLNRLIETFEK